MFRTLSLAFAVGATLVLAAATAAASEGTYYEVAFPASSEPGDCPIGVNFTLWVPSPPATVGATPAAAPLRAIIVHQHGCGAGACRGGATAAYDLHWQALARKWNCGLLGPSYQQQEKQNCRLWCDPRNGSGGVFLRGLEALAEKSGRPEVARVPWCLWGHSGGGFWSSLMQTMYPERIVAIWLRSGTAFATWQKGEIAAPELSPAAYAVPVMCNPGVKEKDHPRFRNAWDGSLAMFQSYRERGAPIGFAPDPNTAHECGDSRYLAIAFFDACLAMRLPAAGGDPARLKPVDEGSAWLAPLLGERAAPADRYSGEKTESVWLPGAAAAGAWQRYVRGEGPLDDSPPPPAAGVAATRRGDDTIELSWTAKADLQSGIAAFVVLRDGAAIGRLPQKPSTRFGRPLFQAMSYHDTPEAPLPEMRFVDAAPPAGNACRYQIVVVNAAGLESKPSAAAVVK